MNGSLYEEIDERVARHYYDNKDKDIVMMSSEYDSLDNSGTSATHVKKSIDKCSFDAAMHIYSSMQWLKTYGYHIRFFVRK